MSVGSNRTLTGANPLDVSIVDGSGNQITSFGGGSGGTAHTDDAAFSIGSASSITPMGALADDTATDTVDEGDAGVVRMDLSRRLLTRIVGATDANRADVDASGRLKVSIENDAVGIGGGTQYTEDAVAAANPVGNMLMAVAENIPNAGVASGDNVALRATQDGALQVKLADTVNTADANLAVAIHNEDNASQNGDAGFSVMAVRKATPANTSGTDGDYEFLQMSAGRLWASTLVTDVVPGVAATSLGKAEDAAHTSGDTGVMALVVRSDAGGTLAGTDGDYTPLQVDANGALRVTGGGGGTEYTEDVAAAADPSGGAVLMTRDDQLSTVTEAEGDWSRLRGTSKGALWVALADSSGDPITSFGGGTQYTEDAAAAADPTGNAMILVRKDTLAALTSTDGDNVAARGTDKGELYVKHVDAIPVTDNGGSLTVDGTVAVTNAGLTELAAAINASSQMDVNVATALPAGTNNIGDVDVLTLPNVTLAAGTNTNEVVGDAAHDAAVAGNPLLIGAYASTLVPSAVSADGDAVRLWALRTGALMTALTVAGGDQITGDAGNGLDVDVTRVGGNVNVIQGTASSLKVEPNGHVAHDAADSSNPLKIGGRADTTFQTAVADGDRVDALFDVYGAQFTRTDHPNRWSYHSDGSSALTDASVQAAPGAGLSVYITDIKVSCGAATAINLFLEEGSTKIWGPDYLEAVAGRTIHIRLRTPKKCTANTALTVTTSGAVAHSVDILGFIAP